MPPKQVAFAVILCVVLCGSLQWPGAAAEEDINDPDVVVLTEDNFDSFVNGEDLSLVEFYAPWCGHCKRLTPEYAKAATALLENDPPIKLAKVDATEQSGLAGRFGVSGYPTLKVFRNGEASDYKGPREEAGIVKHMKRQVGPDAKPVETVAELEALTSGKQDGDVYHVVGLFSSKASALRGSFFINAKKLRDDYRFVVSTAPPVLAAYGVEGKDAIFAVKADGEDRVRYQGSTKTAELAAWIKRSSVPLVGVMSEELEDYYRKLDIPLVRVYGESPSKKQQRRYLTNRVKAMAERHQTELAFVLVNRGEHTDALKELGGTLHEQKQVLVVEKDHGRAKYVMRTPFNKKNVETFITDYLAGKIEKHIKSEDEPANNDGPVKVVTGRTFKSIVQDDKDVMIEFYAPWCGHCKALEPKYKKLGKKFRKNKDVVVAKIDATANDYPDEYSVSGYPTIYFKPAGASSPIKYEDDREVSAMAAYIKKKGKKAKKKKKKKSA